MCEGRLLIMEFDVISPKKETLNEFVFKSQYSTFFQTGYMLDIYSEVPGCEPISLAAVKDNEILASLVGVKFIEKDGVFKRFSTHSTIRGGPIWVDSEIGRKAAMSLIQEYNRRTKNVSLFNKIYPMYDNGLPEVLQPYKYEQEDFLNFLVNLNRSEEEIWNSMNKKRRYGVRKAEKNNLKVKEVENEDEVKIFYELLKETSESANIPIKDYKLFSNIFNILVPKGLSTIYLASYNSTYIGGMLTLDYKNIIYDWYACSSRKHLHLYPNDYLVWHVLSKGSKNGYSLFDFGGAGNPDKPYGVREFKREFGGDVVNYGTYTLINKPVTLNLVTKIYRIYKDKAISRKKS